MCAGMDERPSFNGQLLYEVSYAVTLSVLQFSGSAFAFWRVSKSICQSHADSSGHGRLIRQRAAARALDAPWPWSCRPPLASPWRQSRAAFPRSGRATPLRRWGALRRNAHLLLWRMLTWREETLVVNNNSFGLCGVHWTSRFQVLEH